MSEMTDQHRMVIQTVLNALENDGILATDEGGGAEGKVYGLVATDKEGNEAHLTMALSLRRVGTFPGQE